MTPNTPTDQLDRPLRDLRISVTDRCNFRCAYCMPAEIFGESYRFLPKAEVLTFEEIARLTQIIVRLGAVKLRLTGGEPLVRQDVEELVALLAAIDGVEDFAMTTNGIFLPKKARPLKEAGLRRVTVSLDSLDDAVFRQMSGDRSGVGPVLDGLAAAQMAGFSPIKINCVVQRGVNDHTILDVARFCREHGYVARFIEYMDVGNINGWQLDEVVSAEEIIALIDAEMPLMPENGNYYGEVARRYRYRDGGGEIGVVTSVTRPFCGSCTRARLSPEGEFFTCLFAAKGIDLRGPLRAGASDDEIDERIIRQTWGQREDRYSEERTSLTGQQRNGQKVEMYHIGG